MTTGDVGSDPDVRIALITGEPALEDVDLSEAAVLFADLVSRGAALGWVLPPAEAEVSELLRRVAAAVPFGDAAMAVATVRGEIVGIGYWTRYERPTHRPHADLEKLAVRPDAQGRGIGRALTESLVQAARLAEIEQLTLDLREDNLNALALYTSLGFREYGRLADFVAVDDRRLGKVFLVRDLRAEAGN